MVDLIKLDWNVCDFILAMGMIAVSGYLLLYIIEAVNTVSEEHYTEYEETEDETRCCGESCEYSKEE